MYVCMWVTIRVCMCTYAYVYMYIYIYYTIYACVECVPSKWRAACHVGTTQQLGPKLDAFLCSMLLVQDRVRLMTAVLTYTNPCNMQAPDSGHMPAFQSVNPSSPRSQRLKFAKGQKPVPPVNIPTPTKIGSKISGAPTPKWDPIGQTFLEDSPRAPVID